MLHHVTANAHTVSLCAISTSICMASVPVYSTLSPNVTPYVHTLNAIANLTCMASGGLCSLVFTDRGGEPKGMVS